MCKRCGAEVSPAVDVCPACKTRVARPVAPAQRQPLATLSPLLTVARQPTRPVASASRPISTSPSDALDLESLAVVTELPAPAPAPPPPPSTPTWAPPTWTPPAGTAPQTSPRAPGSWPRIAVRRTNSAAIGAVIIGGFVVLGVVSSVTSNTSSSTGPTATPSFVTVPPINGLPSVGSGQVQLAPNPDVTTDLIHLVLAEENYVFAHGHYTNRIHALRLTTTFSAGSTYRAGVHGPTEYCLVGSNGNGWQLYDKASPAGLAQVHLNRAAAMAACSAHVRWGAEVTTGP